MKELLKNKKALIITCAIFVVIITVIIVVVINNNSNSKEEYYIPQTSYQTEPTSEITIAEPTIITTESTTEAPSATLEWVYKSCEREDGNGYKYEISFKVSPWIMESNTEIANSYWNEISKGKVLPAYDDWGFRSFGGSYIREGLINGGFDSKIITSMTDMYYCMGTITVKNVTDGWNITSDNPRSPFSLGIGLGLFRYDDIGRESYDTAWRAFSAGRVFYTDEEKYYADSALARPKMTSNTWGPVPFILMAPENIVPAYPEGEYKDSILTGGLEICQQGYSLLSQKNKDWTPEGDEVILIGMIGKDGKYMPPESILTN